MRAAPGALRAQPQFVHAQHVDVVDRLGRIAYLGKHVDELAEFLGELRKHRAEHAPAERAANVCRETSVCGTADVDVVVHVDETSREALTEEPRDEQRRVAYLAATRSCAPARPRPRQLLRASVRAADASQAAIRNGRRGQREQVDQVIGGVIVRSHALLFHGLRDRVLEELLQARNRTNSIV